jgi:hypothetical protein
MPAVVPLKYESLKEETRKVGKNGYVGVSRRRLTGARARDEEEFVVVERGFLDPEGGKQWSRFVTLPADPKVVEWLGQALKRV